MTKKAWTVAINGMSNTGVGVYTIIASTSTSAIDVAVQAWLKDSNIVRSLDGINSLNVTHAQGMYKGEGE